MKDDFKKNFDKVYKQAVQNHSILIERYERIISGLENPEDEYELFSAHHFLASEHYNDNPKRALLHAEKALIIGTRMGLWEEEGRDKYIKYIAGIRQEVKNIQSGRPWWKFW